MKPLPLPTHLQPGVRRRMLQDTLALVAAAALPAHGRATETNAPARAGDRALREMQIFRVPPLGLEIWVENQPAWQAELSMSQPHPVFVAQSPERYHPPSAMTYSAWPRERPPEGDAAQQAMAAIAIRRAAQNFGLNLAQARGIALAPATHGVLRGLQADFVGVVDTVPADVRIFVGQATGRFPVALAVYTLQGKMGLLAEPIRRGWGRVKYLAA